MFSVLVIALLLMTGVFYWAANNVHQSVYWADRLCSNAQTFCDHPWWLLAGAVVVLCLRAIGQMLKG